MSRWYVTGDASSSRAVAGRLRVGDEPDALDLVVRSGAWIRAIAAEAAATDAVS